MAEHSKFIIPWLAEELGPLTAKQQTLVTTLERVRIEEFIYSTRGFPGRPAQDRTAIARAFGALPSIVDGTVLARSSGSDTPRGFWNWSNRR